MRCLSLLSGLSCFPFHQFHLQQPPSHLHIRCFQLHWGLDLSGLCDLHVSYESQPLKAMALHTGTIYMAASIRTFDLLLWGRKCQEYAKAKLSYLCHTHNFCTMGTVCIIAVCLPNCTGNRNSHSPRQKYSPVTCSRCAVIENMICACTENC